MINHIIIRSKCK